MLKKKFKALKDEKERNSERQRNEAKDMFISDEQNQKVSMDASESLQQENANKQEIIKQQQE